MGWFTSVLMVFYDNWDKNIKYVNLIFLSIYCPRSVVKFISGSFCIPSGANLIFLSCSFTILLMIPYTLSSTVTKL